MSPVGLLALRLLSAPQVDVAEGAPVDADAVVRGLEARIGDAVDGWSVIIEPAQGGVRVRARAPGRALVDQTVELPEEGSDEARAMIVASTVAFALEQAGTVTVGETQVETPPEPSVENDPILSIPPWWVTANGSLGLGLGPVDPSGGVALDAGRWLDADRHLRISLALGWAHARQSPLVVHAFEPMLQFDVGRALCERTWMGAGLGLGATGAWAFDREKASAWALQVHVPAIIDVVLVGPLFLRGSAGIDIQTPVLNFRGAERTLRWGVIRPFLGLGFGLRLG